MADPTPASSDLLEALVRVRQLLRSPPGSARIPARELRRTLQSLVELFDRLKPFTAHPPHCDVHTLSDTEMYGRRWPRPCSCGLADLIDEKAILVTLRPNETWAERRERADRRNA